MKQNLIFQLCLDGWHPFIQKNIILSGVYWVQHVLHVNIYELDNLLSSSNKQNPLMNNTKWQQSEGRVFTRYQIYY